MSTRGKFVTYSRRRKGALNVDLSVPPSVENQEAVGGPAGSVAQGGQGDVIAIPVANGVQGHQPTESSPGVFEGKNKSQKSPRTVVVDVESGALNKNPAQSGDRKFRENDKILSRSTLEDCRLLMSQLEILGLSKGGEQTDLVQDGASLISQKDRISNMPIEIIHHILSFLDTKYAVQTSKLSRKWKHIWISIPHLNLNSESFRTLPQFARFVKHVLSHRNNQTEVSAAELTLRGAATQFPAKSIVNYANLHNVRQLTVKWVTRKGVQFPQYLFTSHTLKHLTLSTVGTDYNYFGQLPNSTWDLPALETLNLSNMKLGDGGDKRPNLFSKCVNLKELTLHRFSMHNLDIFHVCAPQLSDLTITSPLTFPKVFNVVAPQLKNLIVSVRSHNLKALQLSTEGFNSLEKVILYLNAYGYNMRSYVPNLLDLFQKLHSAKFLILDIDTIECLSSCLDLFSHEPCPFNNLKCLKIDARPSGILRTMPFQAIKYLLESSPNATFVDLHQVLQKRFRQQVKSMVSKKRMLEANIVLEEQFVAQEKAKLEAEIKSKEKFVAQQKVKLEAKKLEHVKLMSEIFKFKMAELQVQFESGNHGHDLARSIWRHVKSIMESTPESLREAMKAQYSNVYQEVKSSFFTRIDASQWTTIETALGYTSHFEKTHIHNKSDGALPPAP